MCQRAPSFEEDSLELQRLRRSPRWMDHAFENLDHAFQGDSVPLLDGEWMVCRLQLDEGTDAIVAQVNHGFEIQSVGIQPNVGTEPAKERAMKSSLRFVEEFDELSKVFLTKGSPYAPRQRLVVSYDGDLQRSADEKGIVVDDARVRRKDTTIRALMLGDLKVLDRIVPSERGNPLVNLVAATTAESKHAESSSGQRLGFNLRAYQNTAALQSATRAVVHHHGCEPGPDRMGPARFKPELCGACDGCGPSLGVHGTRDVGIGRGRHGRDRGFVPRS